MIQSQEIQRQKDTDIENTVTERKRERHFRVRKGLVTRSREVQQYRDT
jgi:hypothetical protein